MELSVSASVRSGFARRAAPICCGAALVAGAGFLATHDPELPPGPGTRAARSTR